ncbi:MAG: hypothetical protein AB8B91_21140 [Rubripirellula sp.]
MNEHSPAKIKQWLLGALMITLFICVCGFLVGLAKGFAGENGSWEKAIDIGAKATVAFLVLTNAGFAFAALLSILKVPQAWRSLILIPFAMAGIHGIQAIIDQNPAKFWSDSSSGFGIGLLIAAGIYWAERKGWIPSNIRSRHPSAGGDGESNDDGPL